MTTARVDIVLRAIGAGDVSGAIAGIDAQVGRLAKSFLRIAAGTVGVSFFARLGREAVEAADKLDDLASRLQVSTDALQALEHLARRYGQTADVFTGGMDRMRATLADARKGVESAYAPFRELGIVLADFEKLTGERQLEALARAVANASDQQRAFAAVSDILGQKNAPQLRAALLELAAGWESVEAAADRAGVRASAASIAAIAEAKDASSELFANLKKEATEALGIVADVFQVGLTPDALSNPRARAAATRLLDFRYQQGAGGSALPTLQAGQLTAQELGALSSMADAEAALAEAARARAVAEESAGVWLTANRKKLEESLAAMRLGALSDEARLVALQGQLAALERQEAAELAMAAGEKERLKIRLQAEEKRLRLTRDVAELEKGIAAAQAATTKRILETNTTPGGSLSYDKDGRPRLQGDLTIEPGKQPLAGSGPGEESRDVGPVRRESVGDALSDARDTLQETGNIFNGLYDSVLRITSGISTGLAGAIEGLINRTMTWREALRSVGSTILSSVVSSFATMVAQYLASQLAIFAISKLFKSKDTAATVSQAATSAVAWAPAATAASIATMGAAAMSGTMAFLAALALGTAGAAAISAATPALMARAAGGPVALGQPYLVGEYGPELIVPRESGIAVNHRETAALAERLGASSSSSGGAPGRVNVIAVDSRREAERIRRGSEAEAQIVEIVRAHKYRILA